MIPLQVLMLWQLNKARQYVSFSKDQSRFFSDWVANDFVEGSDLLGLGIPVRSAYIPLFNRFKQSSSFLKKEMAKYPDCKFEVYGHSLGSMDGQYAVSSLDDDEAKRLSGARVYEGPNIYENLTDAQRKRAKSYQGRVHNYVDQKDLVPLGYPDKKVMAYSSDQAIDPNMGNTVYVYEDSPYVGSLYRIDSKKAKGNNLLSQKINYNKNEEDFISSYFSIFGKEIISINPPELKKLIIKKNRR